MVFSATFNNISVISWRLVLLEETGANHLLTQKRHMTLEIQFLARDGHKHCSITTSI